MTRTSKVDKTDDANNSPEKSGQQPHRVYLPGFITGDEIGLGDAIKRTGSYLGIQAPILESNLAEAVKAGQPGSTAGSCSPIGRRGKKPRRRSS